MGKYSPKERCKPARRRTEAYSSLNCVLANRRVLSFVFKAVGIACFVYWKNRDFGPLKTHPGNPITQEYTKFYCQLFDVWIVKIQILTHFIAATFSRKQFILPFSIHLNPHWNTPSSPHCASTTSAKVMAVFASFTSTGRKSVFPGTCICAEENGSMEASKQRTIHTKSDIVFKLQSSLWIGKCLHAAEDTVRTDRLRKQIWTRRRQHRLADCQIQTLFALSVTYGLCTFLPCVNDGSRRRLQRIIREIWVTECVGQNTLPEKLKEI